MTNPRLTNTAHKPEADFKEDNLKYQNRPVLSTDEVDGMIERVNLVQIAPFYRLRAKCLVALLHKFGKRRCELLRLKRVDIVTVGNNIEFTFTLAKKRKRGFFQYLAYLENLIKKGQANGDALDKPLPTLKAEWKVWQTTDAGHRVKNAKSLQSISLNDKYTHYVTDYLSYLDDKHRDSEYVFPSVINCFSTSYIVDPHRAMSGRQLLRILKELNPRCWTHLFRNSKASEIARLHGRTLDCVQKIQDSLDLETPPTAMIYVKRHAPLEQPVET